MNIFSEGKSKVRQEQRTEAFSLWKAHTQGGEEEKSISLQKPEPEAECQERG